ncbi:MAG: AI-2E family transporter [Lachnospiraceae bacterium]|nr:AI-2E family transporter [Lachnospiraceae bacterium]
MEDKEPKKSFSQLFEENPKRFVRTICIAVIVSVCIIIAFYFMIARYDSFSIAMDKFGLIIQPFIIGFAMAFLMNPIMKVMERPLNKKFATKAKNPTRTKKIVRVLTSIIALIILLALIALVILLIVPDVVATVKDIMGSFGDKFRSALDSFNSFSHYIFNDQVTELKNSKASEIMQSVFAWLMDYLNLGDKSAINSIASGAVTVGHVIVNIIVGIFVSVYALISKDIFRGQLKKMIYGAFNTRNANNILDVGRKTNEIFYGFIIGKIIDSIIIGILCYIGCLILKMPYSVLVSVIVGVTNVIPVFGPYIGAVPTVIIIFITDPIKGLTFLVFVLALQQLDGNVIGPKILGESTGISVFWVVVAIVVGGGLFGFMGMLLGVPTMAVIYYIIGKIAANRVKKKNLPEGTADYIDLNRVDEDTGQMVHNGLEADKGSNTGIFRNFKKRKKAKDIDEKKKVHVPESDSEDNKSEVTQGSDNEGAKSESTQYGELSLEQDDKSPSTQDGKDE